MLWCRTWEARLLIGRGRKAGVAWGLAGMEAWGIAARSAIASWLAVGELRAATGEMCSSWALSYEKLRLSLGRWAEQWYHIS